MQKIISHYKSPVDMKVYCSRLIRVNASEKKAFATPNEFIENSHPYRRTFTRSCRIQNPRCPAQSWCDIVPPTRTR